MNKQVRHLLRPLANRIANGLVRAAVRLVADNGKMQRLQIDGFEGGPADDAEHFQAYGFSSVPLDGAEAIAAFPNGDRERPWVIVVTDRRYRPKNGEPGEVTVYNNTGANVKLTKDGDIIATPAGGRKVYLGSDAAAQIPALKAELADLKARIAAWAPVPNDGGASLKPVIAAWPVVGAAKVKLE